MSEAEKIISNFNKSAAEREDSKKTGSSNKNKLKSKKLAKNNQ